MLTFPSAAKEYADKLAYCYRSKQLLIDWHNSVGAKVDTKDLTALKAFREWARTEWEPRFKACMFTLHSLPGFSTLYAADPWVVAAKKFPTPGEISFLQDCTARINLKVAGQVDSSWDGWIDPTKFPRVGVVGEPPDPTENFTTYTEVDTNNRLSETATQVDWTALLNSETAYLYSDKGAAHFAANFTHLSKAQLTSHTDNADGKYVFQWMLTNTLATANVLAASGGHSVFGGVYMAGNKVFTCHLEESIGSSTRSFDTDVAGSLNTPYWNKFVRDEAVGTYGTLYAYWYTDAARTNQLAAEALALREKADFRYTVPFNIWVQAGNSSVSTGFSGPLDLGEQSVVPLIRHYREQQAGAQA